MSQYSTRRTRSKVRLAVAITCVAVALVGTIAHHQDSAPTSDASAGSEALGTVGLGVDQDADAGVTPPLVGLPIADEPDPELTMPPETEDNVAPVDDTASAAVGDERRNRRARKAAAERRDDRLARKAAAERRKERRARKAAMELRSDRLARKAAAERRAREATSEAAAKDALVADSQSRSDSAKIRAALEVAPAPSVDSFRPLVRKRIRARLSGVRWCIQPLIQRQPMSSFDVALQFDIRADGHVADHSVAVEGVPTETGRCIAKRVAQWRFPEIGSRISVDYPLTVKPRAEIAVAMP